MKNEAQIKALEEKKQALLAKIEAEDRGISEVEDRELFTIDRQIDALKS